MGNPIKQEPLPVTRRRGSMGLGAAVPGWKSHTLRLNNNNIERLIKAYYNMYIYIKEAGF